MLKADLNQKNQQRKSRTLKNKQKNNKKNSGRFNVLAAATVLICFGLYFVLNKAPESPQPVKSSVVWKTASLPKGVTNDIVSETLARLDQLYFFAEHEIPYDENLMRLIRNERASAPTREQMEKDLQTLRGMHLDYIGQFHLSLDMDDRTIVAIQAKIAEMVHKNYDVLWAEDFCGGEIVTSNNAWLQVVAESQDAEVPIAHSFTNEVEIRAYFEKSAPSCASYQFIANPNLGITVRGADYRPVKSLEQHFMSYLLPASVRGKPAPYTFKGTQADLVITTLSQVRNLHILHTIARKADRTKRNVLVLGSAHINHMSYLMAKYGIEGSLTFVQ